MANNRPSCKVPSSIFTLNVSSRATIIPWISKDTCNHSGMLLIEEIDYIAWILDSGIGISSFMARAPDYSRAGKQGHSMAWSILEQGHSRGSLGLGIFKGFSRASSILEQGHSRGSLGLGIFKGFSRASSILEQGHSRGSLGLGIFKSWGFLGIL